MSKLFLTISCITVKLWLDTFFVFRGQETARFENGGQPAVTLEKS